MFQDEYWSLSNSQEYVYNRLQFRLVFSAPSFLVILCSGIELVVYFFRLIEELWKMVLFFSRSYGWYFTFVQGFVYLFLIYLQGFSTKQMVNPWKTYVKLSAVLMGSHGLTKGSLAFLNYPAQLMFKSTKVAVSCKIMRSTSQIDQKCAFFRHVFTTF